MKFGRILLAVMLSFGLAFTSLQLGCKDNSPKNVDKDEKPEDIQLDIEDGDDDDDGDESDKKDDDQQASLNGPKN